MQPSISHENPIRPSPQNAASIHTQGNNFLQTVQTSADPRTGQFNLAISIPLGQANDMSGPSWPFTLAYSALASQQDEGFGFGWSLLYTHLTREQSVWILRLASGEQFSVDLDNSDLQPGGRLAFHDYKLHAMQVTRDKNDKPDGELNFRILHKSGEMEFLGRPNTSGNVYVVHELRNAEGRSLYFDWLMANDVLYLRAVKDKQRTLVRYDRLLKTLTLEPDSSAATTFEFRQANGELSRLILPTADQPFIFRYENQAVGSQRLRLPTQVTNPLGGVDTINWSKTRESSHNLPNKAPIDYMPRVVSWLHSDGPGAASLLHRYQWVGTRNYLGGGSPQEFDWETGRDSLYRLRIPYEYSSSETLITGDNRMLEQLQAFEHNNSTSQQIDMAVVYTVLQTIGFITQLTSISRTWDRHHLQIKEVTQTGNSQTTRDTTYGINYDAAWKDQTAQCQLPHAVKTIYADLEKGTEHCEETTYEYDAFGNILLTRFPTQIIEVSEYYPATGETSGCPLDTSGMVRFLRKKTVYPAPGAPGSAPILSTRYEYQDLPSLISGDPNHAVVTLEELNNESTGELLETTQQAYERNNKQHYGRQTQTITTLNDLSTTTLFQYEIIENPGEPPLLLTRTVVQGFEESEESESQTEVVRALTTGLTYYDQSESGARTVYRYDALGRIVETKIAAGTSYQAIRTCNYHLNDKFVADHAPRLGNTPLATVALEETDATGQRKRTWLDGSARPLLIQLEDLDNRPGVFLDIASIRYDAWGREVEQVQQDWHPDASLLFCLTSTTAYDDWGNACSQTAPTGVVTHILNDPTTLRVEQWQQSTSGTQGPRQVTVSNTAGSPVETLRYDDQGRAIRTTQYIRDGLDRVIEQRVTLTDQSQIVERFKFDAYSRVTEHEEHFKQNDEQQIRRTRWDYALHSDGDHPVSVSVEVGAANA